MMANWHDGSMNAPQNVFITGIGRGLGRELATQLIDDGAHVWGSTRTGEVDLPVAGCVPIELSDEDAIRGGMARLAEGVERLDLLINCAGLDGRNVGVDPRHRGPFDYEPSSFNAVLQINATAPLFITRLALPLLRAAAPGSMVVNISSQLGSMEVAANMGDDTAYCVSKAALNMVTVKGASALRTDGIGVVALHPGWVQTDMGGSAAALTVPESAAAIRKTVAELTPADSGRFLRWDGTDHPW